jgi:alginate O-acetyltransferase complex protein AlgI
MNFATLSFISFLTLVFTLYWVRRTRRWQNTLLVFASYVFYGWWDIRFCGLMLLSSLIDFSIGWWLSISEKSSRRKLLLAASITANLGLLGVFKYFNFFSENLQLLFSSLGWHATPVTEIWVVGA